MKELILTRIMIVFFAALLLMPVESCKKNNPEPDNSTPPIPTAEISGILEITEGADINPSDLTAISFTDEENLQNDGSFTLTAAKADKNQLIFFNTNEGEVAYIGIYNPVQKTIMANDVSTALALTMFNPYLIYSDQIQREEYLNSVKQSSKFDELLNALKTAYQEDATNALNYEKNPEIFQLVAQIIKETLENSGYYNNAVRELGNPPYIEDAPGSKITFVNNRHTWYAAGIYPNSESRTAVTTVNRRVKLISFEPGWPPNIVMGPEETKYDLGDGTFKIHIARGFNFAKFFDWDDQEGRGTIMNTGQSLLYIIDLIVGFVPMPNIATLPNHFHVPGNDAIALSKDIAMGDTQGFIINFFKLIGSNKEELAYWLFQEGNSATANFIKSASGLLKNVAIVFKILGLANEQAPFFWDLIFAPKDVTYFITQTNGVITSSTQNDSPLAEFEISPPAGIVGTNFVFDASNTTDDNDQIDQLQFRWDFEGNNSWTQWENSTTINYEYSNSGSFDVVMEVKDTEGQVSSISHTLNIGGGAGSANHVKLFMDLLPWESNAMVNMLKEIGFTQGTGEYTYEVINSYTMDEVTLVPGQDLVIISNDQPQDFYDNYALNQVKFTNFVYQGGSMFWEACDLGWNEGEIAKAGITFPGNMLIHFKADYYNYIFNPELPLVAGLPEVMDHNFASHEYFMNLPNGTIVYCTNSDSNPTLIEFNLGEGWLLMTGQPLEHQYDHIYGNNDMEELLPRIVGYFTNIQPVIRSRQLKKSVKPSYLK